MAFIVARLSFPEKGEMECGREEVGGYEERVKGRREGKKKKKGSARPPRDRSDRTPGWQEGKAL
jgi:hypothetical protein